jgi:hypothetical protein
MLTLRLGKIMNRLISPQQSAFIQGRYILESVVIAHELVHSLSKSGEPGLILKLDYEKAYDRVNWVFLFEILRTKGFSNTWIDWIRHLVIGGSVGVNLNGEESSFFKPGKGLRQGDPISPLLFNLVGDVLTIMLQKGAEKGIIKGIAENFRVGGIVSLRYANDTILFSRIDEEYTRNLKSIVIWFGQLSGKSELIPMNVEPEEVHSLAHLFSCPVGTLPIKYLGVPLHYEKLSREDIQPLVDKMLKKLAGWRGRLLSYAGKLVPVYVLSFIKFPKWAIILHSHLSNCLWDDSPTSCKIHLANWESVSMMKEYGDLGVPNLRDLNLCLLASWIKRYNLDGDKMWRQFLDFKYKIDRPNIFCSSFSGASEFFKGMMRVASIAKMEYRWHIGNGKKCKFWEDNWLGTSS